MKPFSAFLSADIPAVARLVQRNLTRSAVSEEEAGGAAGVPPQTTVKHLLWDRVTPADRTLRGATVVGVFGAEFSDVGPVEALSWRRRTERAERAA